MVVEVVQRVVRGTPQAIAEVLARTGTGTVIHTAYIERLNGTFRSALAPWVRRGRLGSAPKHADGREVLGQVRLPLLLVP
jgi:hypothetical protein